MRASLSLCGLVLLLAVSQGPAQTSPAWETFSPPGGRCSVKAPGVLREQTGLPEVRKIGKPTSLYLLQKQYHYVLGYTDYPTAKQPPPEERRLDQARDTALKASRGKLLGEKKMALGTFPARELKVEVESKGFARVRFYLVRDRLYFLVVVGAKGVLESRDAERFLDSFALSK